MVEPVDWSKAGTRLRHTPNPVGGGNPDWNLKYRRWKTEADYAADAMTAPDVVALIGCPVCCAAAGYRCTDSQGPIIAAVHEARREAAGEEKVKPDA